MWRPAWKRRETMTEYKRQWRELSDEHKEKISQATAGRPKSAEHRQHISQAMTCYWQTVPHRPDTESGHTTMKDLIGA